MKALLGADYFDDLSCSQRLLRGDAAVIGPGRASEPGVLFGTVSADDRAIHGVPSEFPGREGALCERGNLLSFGEARVSREGEDDLVAMLLADDGGDDDITSETYDVRLMAVPAAAHIIKDLRRSRALNEWLVLDRDGRRFAKGRLVALDGGRA